MNKQKTRQSRVRKGRRNAQNARTFRNIKRRREKHTKSHGITIESLGAKRFVTVPASK